MGTEDRTISGGKRVRIEFEVELSPRQNKVVAYHVSGEPTNVEMAEAWLELGCAIRDDSEALEAWLKDYLTHIERVWSSYQASEFIGIISKRAPGMRLVKSMALAT